MTMLAIRLPVGIINDDGWPPAKSVAFDVHPTAVGRKRVVKIILRDFSRLFGGRFCCRRGGRRRLRCCRYAQLLIALHHRGDGVIRQAEVFQVNDLIRSQIERCAGIIDVTDDDTFIHAGLREPDDLRQRAVWRNIRRQNAGRRRLR